jgi:hypothetical protein
MGEQSKRSAAEVFHDHLHQAKAGRVEDDIRRNYAPEVLLLTGRGIYHGYDGLWHLAQLLEEELPNVKFDYRTVLVEGELAFLEWTAQSDKAMVKDGADSFVIRDGRIIAQTIHYTVEPRA